jgi:glyoxylase-like metal-dependent hydrolase (beta-lactamase superfamily II)/8-oxo-dGTP pyrophosphatase MutT (NUDIX family)
MAFGPGLHVFPGGAVDADDWPGDGDGPLAARSSVSGVACSAAWAGDLAPEPALAHAIAAVRELYEEAGVLLATRRDGSPVGDGIVARAAAVGEPLTSLAGRLDLVLAVDRLVPLSRWVTPPTPDATRRFDTRFFVAALPEAAALAVHAAHAHEVAAHEWIAPGEALARYAAGSIDLWPPTSATLHQIEPARGVEDVRAWLAPVAAAPAPRVERVADGVLRVRLGSAGGIPGATVDAWIVGRRRVAVVDPGDPTDAGLEAILAATAAAGLEIAAVMVTSGAPDRAGGAVGLALVARVPLLASGPAASLVGEPAAVVEDGARVEAGDDTLVVRAVDGDPDGAILLAVPSLGVVLTGGWGTDGGSRTIPGARGAGVRARGEAVLERMPGRRLPAHG